MPRNTKIIANQKDPQKEGQKDIRLDIQKKSQKASYKEGMILVTTLVVMLMVALLGAGMLFSTRAELTTTTNYRQSVKAFNNADAVVQLAIRAVDVIAYGTVEDVRDHLTYNTSMSDYRIEVSDRLANLNSETGGNRHSAKDRYLGVGLATSGKPDIIVRDKDGRLVGTVMISHDFAGSSSPFSGAGVGSSGGIADQGSTGVGGLGLQYYVITVSGKDPTAPGGQSFFLDSGEKLETSGPQTFITVLYSVVRAN
ncbi:MAG: hypothetical protein LBE31_03825 [Deltaproteobacteria bacterium]|jgi:Tfp pilus assembly protein PilX|nr:hypothetical protein [Deltaproteobacteria bacterium]